MVTLVAGGEGDIDLSGGEIVTVDRRWVEPVLSSWAALGSALPVRPSASHRVHITGGGARLAPGVPTEADDTAALLDALGFDRPRVVFEDRSANTCESAILSARLLTPEPGEVWLLVTSAAHMPRSVGAFRKAGWDPLPYPIDYSTYGALPAFVPAIPDPSGHLHAVRDAVHESWVC